MFGRFELENVLKMFLKFHGINCNTAYKFDMLEFVFMKNINCCIQCCTRASGKNKVLDKYQPCS